MSKHKNFLSQAFDAIVAGRTRAAERYIEQYERSYGKADPKFTKR